MTGSDISGIGRSEIWCYVTLSCMKMTLCGVWKAGMFIKWPYVTYFILLQNNVNVDHIFDVKSPGNLGKHPYIFWACTVQLCILSVDSVDTPNSVLALCIAKRPVEDLKQKGRNIGSTHTSIFMLGEKPAVNRNPCFVRCRQEGSVPSAYVFRKLVSVSDNGDRAEFRHADYTPVAKMRPVLLQCRVLEDEGSSWGFRPILPFWENCHTPLCLELSIKKGSGS